MIVHELCVCVCVFRVFMTWRVTSCSGLQVRALSARPFITATVTRQPCLAHHSTFTGQVRPSFCLQLDSCIMGMRIFKKKKKKMARKYANVGIRKFTIQSMLTIVLYDVFFFFKFFKFSSQYVITAVYFGSPYPVHAPICSFSSLGLNLFYKCT